MTSTNKATKPSRMSATFSEARKSFTKSLKGRSSVDSAGSSSFLKDIIKTPRSSKGTKANSKKPPVSSQAETTPRESTSGADKASEQLIKTPPQLDEKATVPKLKLSQLEETPSPTAQPAPAPTAAAIATEPAAEPAPVINASEACDVEAPETPTPEKSSSPAPKAQPEVQAEAPSIAAPTQAPSIAAPTQAPSKAAKGHRGFVRLIPALLVAGVCVFGALRRSGKDKDRSSSPSQYRTSGRGALEVKIFSALPAATWTGSRPSALSS